MRQALSSREIASAENSVTINGLTAYLILAPDVGRVELSGTSESINVFLALANPLQEQTCHELARSAYRRLVGVLENYGTLDAPHPNPNG